MRRHLFGLTVGGALLLTTVGSAHGQDALGSGNALDADLGAGSFPPARASTLQIYRDRNLVVTGNVAGGRGFRGSVGYAAVGDFRGAVGSDDLFEFRSGSAFSSLPFIARGRTEQRLRYGRDLGLIEYRRAAAGATARTLGERHTGTARLMDAQLRLDRLSRSSSSAGGVEAAAEPRIIGTSYDAVGEPLMISTSSLRGMHVVPARPDVQRVGLSTYDLLRLRQDAAAGRATRSVGAPFETSFEDLRVIGVGIGTQAVDDRIVIEVADDRRGRDQQPDYQKILQRIAERYAEAEDVDLTVGPQLLRHLDEEFEVLRRRLVGGPDEEEAPNDPRSADPSTEPPPAVGAPALEPGFSPWPSEPPDRPELGTVDLGLILRHDRQVAQLPGADQSRLNELLATAEERLRNGEYFLAERRFGRVLRFTPGHPLATAGMAHAQIGAGLYASAALNLRSMLRHHPEMIDVKYEQSLLPNRSRLRTAIEEVRSRSDARYDRASHGFLLAYLGHQLDDSALLEEGLGIMAEAAPKDVLLPLLERIWSMESASEDPAPEG